MQPVAGSTAWRWLGAVPPGSCKLSSASHDGLPGAALLSNEFSLCFYNLLHCFVLFCSVCTLQPSLLVLAGPRQKLGS